MRQPYHFLLFCQIHYKIQTNDTRLENTKTDENIICYVSQQKGFIKYINKKEIKKSTNNYKLITARANGGNGCFGNSFVGKPNEVHTKSYISFNLTTENEALSLLSYMKCKLPNFMLSLRKISQDISESTCKWIPLPELNKEWNDEEVYKYFKLSEEEIKLVKDTKVIGYNDIKQINENEPKIIKDGRKQYYLINEKLFKVKKDKSQGELFGSYIDGKIIEGIKNNDELVDEPIIEVKKKKSIKKPTKEDNDELVNEPIIEVKKKILIVKKS